MSVSTAQHHGSQLAQPDVMVALRYALVHDWLPSLGGSELVFKEICSMFPGDAYTSLCRLDLLPWLEGRTVHTSAYQHLPFALRKHYAFAPLMPSFYRGLTFEGVDVLLVDSHSFAHHSKAPEGVAYLCYYHTSARSLWNPEIDDRATSGRLAGVRRLLVPRLKRLDLEASRNPQYIVANSKTTADRLRTHYSREADEVIYPPVETAPWLEVKRSSEDEGFLIWGRIIGYKRIDLAIEAARRTKERLHIVGAGPLESRLKAQAQGLSNVLFHGRLSDSDLYSLMSRCRAVLFPGYEDFGLVPVEAMAAGLPVIAYAAGGASESVKDEQLLFGSQDVSSLVEAMVRLGTVKVDPDRLRARAREFDASVFRRKYCEAVQRCIERNAERRVSA